ncbi:MAG: hypothetical protein IJ343_07960 [Clostridia bacterium]|nr:hypothetical protein [Clostridia bacterium]
MKRVMAVFCLLMTLCVGAAAADEAVFASTQAFLQLMQESRVWCEFTGLEGDGEHVITEVSTQEGYPVALDLCFAPDGRRCTLRAGELIAFAQPQQLSVLKVCNDLNSDFRYVRFHIEEDSRTVTAVMDVRFIGQEAGETVWDAMQRLLVIVEEGLPALTPLSGR